MRYVNRAWSALVVVGLAVVAIVAFRLTERAIAEDRGDSMLAEAQKNFEPLPKDASTGGQRPTPAQVSLGRMLFFDSRISDDGTGSCVRCHQPALYGADALPKSLGLHDKRLARNAPTVLNIALHFKVHWDARKAR